jgi:GT2 family glycosyltransferase
MDVTVAIVNYNTCALTVDCIRSVFEKTSGPQFEIAVVDNASTDGSHEIIPKTFPEIQFIKNEKNLGFGAANNLAVRRSKAKYVLFLNSDTVLLNNAIRIFFDFMELPKNNDVGCCGGELFNADRSRQAAYGNFPTLQQVVFIQSELRSVFRKYYDKALAAAVVDAAGSEKNVPYINGADMFVRRSVLDRIGGFDEDFFLYFEETELCFRMDQHAIRRVVIPEARILHYGGQSFGEFSLKRFEMIRHSELIFFEKCYGRASRYGVQALHIAGTLVRLIFTWNKKYYRSLKVLFKLSLQ